MVYAAGQLLLVVSDHDEGDGGLATIGIDDVLYHLTVLGVEAMKGLVEDKE